MEQWGFAFNQDRCLGCKACVLACKNWNEGKRGDVLFNDNDVKKYMVENGQREKKVNYVDPVTGETNYNEYKQLYMKENWRRVDTFEKGAVTLKPDNTFGVNLKRHHLTISCNHCEEPACVDACPVCCYYKEPTIGAVLYKDHCISCGRCVSACPWGAPQFYDENYAKYAGDDPRRPRVTKCNMCIDRVKEGLKPACVAACWNRALDAGYMGELRDKYISKGYTILESIPGEFEDLSTKPNIIFVTKKA